MSESRDRLERRVDYAEVFARRRSEIGIFDEQEIDTARATTTTAAQPRSTISRRSFGSSVSVGIGRNRFLYRSPVLSRENSSAGSFKRSRSRSRNSVLPFWYPRTPLRDITAVVRAIERTRARLRENEGQGSDHNNSTAPSIEQALDLTTFVTGNNKEPSISLVTPKPRIGKVRKILHGITNVEETELLTPQKKLLNSIDKVGKVVRQELQKLRTTPSAKRVERQKRVRTLMSFR